MGNSAYVNQQNRDRINSYMPTTDAHINYMAHSDAYSYRMDTVGLRLTHACDNT